MPGVHDQVYRSAPGRLSSARTMPETNPTFRHPRGSAGRCARASPAYRAFRPRPADERLQRAPNRGRARHSARPGHATHCSMPRTSSHIQRNDAETLVACGGWSERRTLFGSDGGSGRDAGRLDPFTDAARIRAIFVHPDWARRGLGTLMLEHCEIRSRACRLSTVRDGLNADRRSSLSAARLHRTRTCGGAAAERRGASRHPMMKSLAKLQPPH